MPARSEGFADFDDFFDGLPRCAAPLKAMKAMRTFCQIAPHFVESANIIFIYFYAFTIYARMGAYAGLAPQLSFLAVASEHFSSPFLAEQYLDNMPHFSSD